MRALSPISDGWRSRRGSLDYVSWPNQVGSLDSPVGSSTVSYTMSSIGGLRVGLRESKLNGEYFPDRLVNDGLMLIMMKMGI